jgi:hypothetical protein
MGHALDFSTKPTIYPEEVLPDSVRLGHVVSLDLTQCVAFDPGL